MNKPYCLNPIRFAFKRAGAETVYKDLVAPYFRLTKTRAHVAAIAGSNLATVGGGVFFNNLYGRFLDHLSTGNTAGFNTDIKLFLAGVGVIAGITAVRSFYSASIANNWCDWARSRMIESVCAADRRGGFAFASNGEQSQTGQRVSDDIWSAIRGMNFLVGGGIQSATNVIAFSCVLCAISPAIWSSLAATSAVGLVVSKRWAKRLQTADDEIAKHTNNYRNAVVETAKNKQTIELMRGEEAEINRLKIKQTKLTRWMQKRIVLGAKLNTWTSIADSASRIVPYAIGGKMVFDHQKNFSVGKWGEATGTSSYITGGISWFLNVAPEFNYLRATLRRLEEFHTWSKATLPDGQVPIYAEGEKPVITIKGLELSVKDCDPLCEPIDLLLNPGDRIALTGHSGCGKTTFLRQLAGVIPIKNGCITYSGLTSPNEAFFVPQIPYLPDLSLPEILCYPRTGIVFTKEAMEDALNRAGLPSFKSRLDDMGKTGFTLDQEMSGGEKQRLNFARLFLHKPKVIGLDEATSSLPKQDGIDLYQRLIDQLPDSIVISTIHRRELIPLHTIEGNIENKRWRLAPSAQHQPIASVRQHGICRQERTLGQN